MTLSNRSKYDLSKVLAQLVYNPNDIKMYSDETIDDSNPNDVLTFNYSAINIMGGLPVQDLWAALIDAAEEQKLLKQLLIAVRNKNPNNDKLESFYNDITTGFEKRVDKIARAIKDNQCVLFLGPEILQCRNGNRLEAFSRFVALELSNKLRQKGVYYDKKLDYSISYMANRYEDIPGVANREVGLEAQRLYNQASFVKDVFDKICDLSFPLVITTNPDDLLEKEYTNRNIKFSSAFYNRSNQDLTTAVLDDQLPVIYKIFGCISSPFSVLFTDNDRVQFSKNVVKNDPPIPSLVKVLLENKYCLFLGFNFQEWHLKILIDCLGLAKKEERTFAILLENANESSIEHFEKYYNFYFINEEVESFLDQVISAKNKLP